MEMSFNEVVEVQLEFEQTLEQAVESALSLVTGGMFDAVEGDKRTSMIKQAMAVYKQNKLATTKL